VNERIRELAEQATEIIDVSAKLGMPGTDRIFNKEKFAELIVKECMRVGRTSQINNGLVDTDIKEHFGVE
jgi:hypothetical protein